MKKKFVLTLNFWTYIFENSNFFFIFSFNHRFKREKKNGFKTNTHTHTQIRRWWKFEYLKRKMSKFLLENYAQCFLASKIIITTVHFFTLFSNKINLEKRPVTGTTPLKFNSRIFTFESHLLFFSYKKNTI